MKTRADRAWVAGILEGEGSFGYGAVHKDRTRQLRITCGMTDLDVMRRLHSLAGGRLYTERRKDPRRAHSKQMYIWNLCKRKDVVDFLRKILPFMGERRGAKINELLAYAKDHPIKYRGLIHGTRNGYSWWRCRCRKCKDAIAKYARDHRMAKKQLAR